MKQNLFVLFKQRLVSQKAGIDNASCDDAPFRDYKGNRLSNTVPLCTFLPRGCGVVIDQPAGGTLKVAGDGMGRLIVGGCRSADGSNETAAHVIISNGTVNTKVDKTSYNGSYSVNGQWTVWNGNRNYNNIKRDRLAEEEAELSAQETANSIQERIAQLYAQILYMAENVTVNEQMLETSKKNEDRGREMLEVGKMSKADLAQLSAQRANDEYSIVEAKSQLMNYELQLKQLLEITDEERFQVAIPKIGDDQILAEIPAMQTVYEMALVNRPEINRYQLAINRSDVNLSIAKAGWMPTVNLTGGVTTSTNSLSGTGWGSQFKSNVNTSLGLGVTMPIYDGRSTKTSVNKAKIQQLQARLDLQDMQKDLYSDIQSYWLNAWTNQEKYKAASSSVESAQQSYDLLSEQFRLGLKNIVELMSGKDKLLEAQQNLLQSKYMTLYYQQMLKFYENGEMN